MKPFISTLVAILATSTATLALSTGTYDDQSFLERRANDDDASSTADIVSGLEQSSGDDQNRNFANTLASLHKTPPPIPPRSKPQDQQESINYDSESDDEESTQEMLDPSQASFWESGTSSQSSFMPEMSPDTPAFQSEITPSLPLKPKGNDRQKSADNGSGSGGWTQEAFDQFIASLRISKTPPQFLLGAIEASSQSSSMPEMSPDTPAFQSEITPSLPLKPKGNDHQESNEDDSGSEISSDDYALEGTARKDRGRGETTKYRPSKKPTSLR
ncbi:hypothetical protein BSLG_002379 [Batrachochytrium salamandrivorans]|nr:hypothetical protein BSLG_002379 [Batrachochytrium salamandrivorans]